MSFLPVTPDELKGRQVDFILISGDAYIDHPSFGVAIISRALEVFGYSVAIIPQPNWKDTKVFTQFGPPRLGFLISAGNIDSMVNHYTVAKKRRNKDYYTPNGLIGKRPDRATIVYSKIVRKLYPNVPIILGGIEASLRRLAHYDYWDDRVRESILLDADADLVIYGMADKSIVEVAEALDSGLNIKDIIYIQGTVWKTKDIKRAYNPVFLPSYEEICKDKRKYAESFKVQHDNIDAITSKTLVEPYQDWFIVQNKSAYPLTQKEMDFIYSLPYERAPHPMYDKIGKIPAIEEVKFSIISNRGCFGSCSFCALTHHQGRVISTRSEESILEEAKKLTEDKDFKGYIHDIGGPTANFQRPSCDKQLEHGVCKNKECLHPNPCRSLIVEHERYRKLLSQLRALPKVKKVFIRSGIRYDYLMYDKDDAFFHDLIKYHISGQLKVAPEHVSQKVLEKMGKPNQELYNRFVDKFNELNKKYQKKQFLVPYLMSSHPGCDLNSAIELAEYLRDHKCIPEQVQDFYPTPGTISTCMYYTGIDPRDFSEVYVPKSKHEKAMQRALIQFNRPNNYELVREALERAGRLDLIGYDKKSLIKPIKSKNHN